MMRDDDGIEMVCLVDIMVTMCSATSSEEIKTGQRGLILASSHPHMKIRRF